MMVQKVLHSHTNTTHHSQTLLSRFATAQQIYMHMHMHMHTHTHTITSEGEGFQDEMVAQDEAEGGNKNNDNDGEEGESAQNHWKRAFGCPCVIVCVCIYGSGQCTIRLPFLVLTTGPLSLYPPETSTTEHSGDRDGNGDARNDMDVMVVEQQTRPKVVELRDASEMSIVDGRV